jgi:N-acetylmuramoyl-L-alanine amidase/CHAT domain-containing protein/tetratricopeptide (TPR) repeat protein
MSTSFARTTCLLAMVLLTGTSLAQQARRDPSQLCGDIRAASEKRNLAEVLQLFHSQPDFATAGKVPVTAETVGAAYDVATAAAVLRDPAFPGILVWAEDMADKASRSKNPAVSFRTILAHTGLLRELQLMGRFEEAYDVAEKASKRRASLKNGGAIGREAAAFVFQLQDSSELNILLGAIGDYETLEQKHSQTIQMLQSRTSHIRGAERAFASMGADTSMLPMLASIKVRLGKANEARALLEQYEQAQLEQQKAMAQSPIRGITELQNVLAMRDAGSQMAMGSTWLDLGEPLKALDCLDVALSNHRKSTEAMKLQFKPDPSNPLSGPAGIDALQKEYLKGYYTIRARCHLALGDGSSAEKAILEVQSDGTLHHSSNRMADLERRVLLAWAQFLGGKRDAASALALELSREHLAFVDELFHFAGERQRLACLQQMDPFSLLAATGQEQALISTILRLKGVVLDSVLEERRMLANIGEGEGRSLLTQLLDHRHQLGSASLLGSEERDRLRTETERLERQIASLASTQLDSRAALTVTEAQIQAALAPTDAVVEFIRYRQLNASGKWEPHYGAVLFRPEAPSQWVPLGEAGAPDAAITRLNAQWNGAEATAKEEAFKADLQLLYARLLAPLAPHLANARRLVLSPDGNLSLLSFAVLVNPEGQFASETWEMAYVSSARDVLRETKGTSLQGAKMLILAAPEFSAAQEVSKEVKKSRGAPAFDRNALPTLSPLPGALREMQVLQEMAGPLGVSVASYSGAEATEQPLANLAESPGVIHFATHGLVLPASQPVRMAASGLGPDSTQQTASLPTLNTTAQTAAPRFTTPPVTNNPLERSILALAGANTTFAKWRTGVVPAPERDGVLTAAEIATLDLGATWLAVLSACQTASGEAVTGEGVLGMRRGFFLAGVDHLMMTFWPIADEETVQLMEAFYQKIGAGAHPAAALHQVQRDALVKWRQERGLVPAVFLAGPFALSTSGRPFAPKGVAQSSIPPAHPMATTFAPPKVPPPSTSEDTAKKEDPVWKVVEIGDDDYIAGESLQKFYRFATHTIEGGKDVFFRNPNLILKTRIDSQELFINNTKFLLQLPVLMRDGQALISRRDLVWLIEPVIRPSQIEGESQFDTVVLDAGHGGHDLGEKGVHGHEKNYAMALTLAVREALIERGFKVILTRDQDVFVPQAERVALANKTPKSLYLSLHFAASPDESQAGVQTTSLLMSPQETGSDRESIAATAHSSRESWLNTASIALSTAVHANIVSRFKCEDRGIRQSLAPELEGLTCPGVLFEGGFLSNDRDAHLIAANQYREAVAKAIADGVMNFQRAVTSRRKAK